MKNYTSKFQKNQGSILPNPSNRIQSLIKTQIVNRLSAAKYQGIKGPGYFVARAVQSTWGGFGAA